MKTKMSFKTIISILALFIFASCKKETPASIKIKLGFENKENKEIPNLYFICVYKNDKIFKKYSRFEKPYIEKEIIIDSLSNGNYKIVYSNFLKQTLEKKVIVKENKIYNVSIVYDYSDYKKFIKNSYVKNLKNNEKVEFLFESNSCMGSFKGNISITKKGNQYFIERNGIVKELNKKEIDLIIKMECELNLLQDSGCTTSDHYIVKCRELKKDFFDTTCSWYGWMNMNKEIN